MVNWLIEKLLQFIGTIVSGVLGIMIYFFTESMDLDTNFVNGEFSDSTLTLFFDTFPLIKTVYEMIIVMAYAIIFLIVLFQIFKALLGPIAEAESPGSVIVKGLVAGLMVGFSKIICQLFFAIGTVPYQAIKGLETTPFDFAKLNTGSQKTGLAGTFENVNNALGLDTFFFGILIMFVSIFIMVAILVEFCKLMLELCERYVVLGLLSVFAPLCIATSASKATSNIAKSWVRVMVSQTVVMSMSIFFLSIFIHAFGTAIGNYSGDYLLGLLLVLAWVITAQRIDSHMGTLGLSTIQTGSGGMLSSLRGAASIARPAAARATNAITNSKGAKMLGLGGTNIAPTSNMIGKINPKNGRAYGGVLGQTVGGYKDAIARTAVGAKGVNPGENLLQKFAGGKKLSSNDIHNIASGKWNAPEGTKDKIQAGKSLKENFDNPLFKNNKAVEGKINDDGTASLTLANANGEKTNVGLSLEKPEKGEAAVAIQDKDGNTWYATAQGVDSESLYGKSVEGGMTGESLSGDAVVSQNAGGLAQEDSGMLATNAETGEQMSIATGEDGNALTFSQDANGNFVQDANGDFVQDTTTDSFVNSSQLMANTDGSTMNTGGAADGIDVGSSVVTSATDGSQTAINTDDSGNAIRCDADGTANASGDYIQTSDGGAIESSSLIGGGDPAIAQSGLQEGGNVVQTADGGIAALSVDDNGTAIRCNSDGTANASGDCVQTTSGDAIQIGNIKGASENEDGGVAFKGYSVSTGRIAETKNADGSSSYIATNASGHSYATDNRAEATTTNKIGEGTVLSDTSGNAVPLGSSSFNSDGSLRVSKGDDGNSYITDASGNPHNMDNLSQNSAGGYATFANNAGTHVIDSQGEYKSLSTTVFGHPKTYSYDSNRGVYKEDPKGSHVQVNSGSGVDYIKPQVGENGRAKTYSFSSPSSPSTMETATINNASPKPNISYAPTRDMFQTTHFKGESNNKKYEIDRTTVSNGQMQRFDRSADGSYHASSSGEYLRGFTGSEGAKQEAYIKVGKGPVNTYSSNYSVSGMSSDKSGNIYIPKDSITKQVSEGVYDVQGKDGRKITLANAAMYGSQSNDYAAKVRIGNQSYYAVDSTPLSNYLPKTGSGFMHGGEKTNNFMDYNQLTTGKSIRNSNGSYTTDYGTQVNASNADQGILQFKFNNGGNILFSTSMYKDNTGSAQVVKDNYGKSYYSYSLKFEQKDGKEHMSPAVDISRSVSKLGANTASAHIDDRRNLARLGGLVSNTKRNKK